MEATHHEGEVTDVPRNFKKWVGKNEGRIASAKKLPNFLKDNEQYWKGKKNTWKEKTDKAEKERQKSLADYHLIKSYYRGSVYVHNLVSSDDSDYNKLVEVADFFARQGKEVRLTPKRKWHSEFDYDSIYGSLKGTPYYGKCPDMQVDKVWYEHEGFVSKKPKNALRNMLNDGLVQSNRLVIDKPELTEAYIKRSIRNHISNGAVIDELWLKEGENLKLVYKKSEE